MIAVLRRSIARSGTVAAAAFFLILLEVRCVRADGFTLEAGKGQVIVSADFIRSTDIYGRKGRLAPGARTTKREASTYVEYGLTDALTALGKVTLIDRKVASLPPGSYQGLDYAEAGLRARLWQAGAFVLALQSMLRIPGASDQGNPAEFGHTGFESDWRVQGAASFSLFSWSGFGSASLGYRTRSGGPADEFRADLTLGISPRAHWLWLLQSFSTLSNGAGGPGFPAIREHKLQSSLVYRFARAWSLQVGTIGTVAGRNTTRDVGGFIALWRQF